MKILIFGGRGFVGKNLISELTDEKIKIIIPSREFEKKSNSGNTTFLPFDIEKNIKDEQPDIIINLIGILKETSGQTYEKVHIEYTKKIVELSLEIKTVKKIIYLSALGVNSNSKSRYFRTKKEAEDLIINSNINYLILRPSIIIGKGQKLYNEVKNISRITPIIFVPDKKVAPVKIDKVIETIKKGIFEDLNGLYELYGETITYRELFKKILHDMGIKRAVISLPVELFFPFVFIHKIIPSIPITRDIYEMMKINNIPQ